MGYELDVMVTGRPAPQGSKGRTRHGGLYEMSKHLEPWRRAIVLKVRAALTDDAWPKEAREGPVAAHMVFMLARPDSHYRTGAAAGQLKASAPLYPITRPDVDKLARAVLDGLTLSAIAGLTLSGAIKDDGQVVVLSAVKAYAAAGQTGARIHLEAL